MRNETASQAGLAGLLSASGLALLDLDSGLRLSLATAPARALLGLTEADLGRPLPPLAADPWLAADAAEALARGQPRLREVAAGSGAVFQRRATPHEAGVVVTYADLSERRAAARALHAAQAQLRETTAAHARILGTAGHDLRQPLQILSLLHGLAMRATDAGTTQRLLRQMEPMIATVAALLDQLRDAGRSASGMLAPQLAVLPPAGLLDQMRAEFAPLAAARGVVLRVIPSSEPILSDPALLGQILRDLLAAALDHAAPGRLLLGCRRRGAHLAIELHHPGLPRHEPSGLARCLAAQLDHRIGQGPAGSCVEVARAIGQVPSALLPRAPRAGTLLVVESDAALRRLLAELLGMEGHRVIAAGDPAEALALAPDLQPPPDIVLVGEALPGPLGGLELGQALRGLWGEALPVLVLTEGECPEGRAAIAAAGQVQLPKPVKPHSLAGLVQSLLPDDALPAPAPAAPAGARLVYLVDDDPALCAALGGVLTEAGYTVRDYPSAEAFLAAYQRGGNACLLVDARLPGLSGLELLARLREAGDPIPSVMITGYTDLTTAVLALRRGAADFVTKPVRLRVLLEVLERAMAHVQDSGKRSAAQAEAAERLKGLTQRQREILDRVLAGQPSKNIAADLGISRRTVEVHRAAIMKQLKARSLPALVRLVLTATGREEGA